MGGRVTPRTGLGMEIIHKYARKAAHEVHPIPRQRLLTSTQATIPRTMRNRSVRIPYVTYSGIIYEKEDVIGMQGGSVEVTMG